MSLFREETFACYLLIENFFVLARSRIDWVVLMGSFEDGGNPFGSADILIQFLVGTL